MSKGANTLVGKSEIVAAGMKKTVKYLSHYGITEEVLAEFEENIEKVKETDAIVDAELKVLAAKRAVNTAAKEKLYEQYLELKKIVKTNYPKEDWYRYGVVDKQ